MTTIFTFGARLSFSGKNASEPYIGYGEERILVENGDIARKAVQGGWLCRAAGRAGV